jgi:hypothetical protein
MTISVYLTMITKRKNIVLNPPQFIFIPASQGRKVLLIGARDSALIETIINTAPKYNLQVEITKQFSSNERLLLPDVITIKSFNQSNDTYGEKSLKAFAEELQNKIHNRIFSSNCFARLFSKYY